LPYCNFRLNICYTYRISLQTESKEDKSAKKARVNAVDGAYARMAMMLFINPDVAKDSYIVPMGKRKFDKEVINK
jgi:hypothetical protein